MIAVFNAILLNEFCQLDEYLTRRIFGSNRDLFIMRIYFLLRQMCNA